MSVSSLVILILKLSYVSLPQTSVALTVFARNKTEWGIASEPPPFLTSSFGI